MRRFEYASAVTKEQAVALLGANWEQAQVLAGGTDLLSLMKDGIVHPRRLVNIKNIKEMKGVQVAAHGLRIGALTTLNDLSNHAQVIRDYPALAHALDEAASPQIRNLATLGGNLSQRPRCWYFRRGYGLLPKDPSVKDLVAEGENRYHAILANDGPAKFVSPSTIVPVLIAYRASIRIVGPASVREVPLEKYYVIPRREGEREHDLRPNEMISEVWLPDPGETRVSHYEIRQKQAFDWPLAVAAVALTMGGERVQSARIVMGHVAPIPWISPEAEHELAGKAISDQTARNAAGAALRNATPLSRNAYKVQLARVAVKRAILKAAGLGAA